MLITIPNHHPAALNQYIGKHWAIGAKLKKLDKEMILGYCQHVPKATTKRRVDFTIILGKGQKSRDPDAYQKSLGDALVNAGMLVDDSAKWIEWGNVEYIRGIKATLIKLTDMPTVL